MQKGENTNVYRNGKSNKLKKYCKVDLTEQ